MMTQQMKPEHLEQAWQDLLKRQPKIRIRDAAETLGVSEAALLATQTGRTVTKLTGDFGELLVEAGKLGRVMALTRNSAVVHERKGCYSKVELKPERKSGLVLDEGIDLRLFFKAWRHGFAVEGEKRSLQFFNAAGEAVHKIFLLPESNTTAFSELVKKYRSSDQSREFQAEPKATKKVAKSDAEIDIVSFRSRWAKMTDTHEFSSLIREFKIGREQALRLADKDFAFQVKKDSYRKILETAAAEKFPIMVFVGNDGVIQIHSGEVHRVLPYNDWFNVMDADFNLHIHEPQIACAWVVRKPTSDGIVTSLELFNAEGENVALFFSKRKPGETESERWRKLLSELDRI